MSPLPKPTRPLHHHRRLHTAGAVREAEVIEIRPWPAARSAAVEGSVTDRSEETVVLGRSIPYRAVVAAADARTFDSAITNPVAGASIVDHGFLHPLLVHGRDGRSSAPPPSRVRHRPWMLSSVLIAGGGILAVMIAGELAQAPLVASIALLATVLCGAILVAAQLSDEVRRARHRPTSPETVATGS